MAGRFNREDEGQMVAWEMEKRMKMVNCVSRWKKWRLNGGVDEGNGRKGVKKTEAEWWRDGRRRKGERRWKL